MFSSDTSQKAMPEGPRRWPVDLARLHADISACRRCVHAGHAVLPPPVTHLGRPSPLMILGQAPGSTEQKRGQPFQGPSGKRLDAWMQRAHITHWRDRVYLTSVTKCYPGRHTTGKGDRVPSPTEIALCRPWLDSQLATIEPRTIVTLGKLALVAVAGPEAVADGLTPLIGTLLHAQGRTVLPLPHPSPASPWEHMPGNAARLDRALRALGEAARAGGLPPASPSEGLVDAASDE